MQTAVDPINLLRGACIALVALLLFYRWYSGKW